MSDRKLRVGLFQVLSHPAATLADRDLLEEPFSAETSDYGLTILGRQSSMFRPCLEAVKNRYLNWQTERLELLLQWLIAQPDQPDFVVFPECSLPFECLPIIRKYAQQTRIVFFAGTHTPKTSPQAATIYKKSLGIHGRFVKQLLGADNPPPAVLPIITADESLLSPKQYPSVFELTEATPSTNAVLPVSPVVLGEKQISIATLVCAEALQIHSWSSPRPELVVIVARERNPERFHKQIEMLVENKIPVVLANDGAFGGSGVFAAVDRRTACWWYDAPHHGRLPIGEAYVEVELDLETPAVEVGTVLPHSPARLLRVVPILAADDPLLPAELAAAEAAKQFNRNRLNALLLEIDKSPQTSPLIASRWRLLDAKLASETLSESWLQIVGQHICTGSLKSLASLEGELAQLVATELTHICENTTQSTFSDELYGRVARMIRAMQSRRPTLSPPGPTSQPDSSRGLPIGRAEILAELRSFVASKNEPLFAVTGLEAVGKSCVVDTALQQSGARFLTVTCLSGNSADYLFEQLLRAAGRVPAGEPPRDDFRVEDLVDALAAFEVIWFRDCHHLLEYGKWRTNALERLFERLLESRQRTATHLLFESRQALPVTEPLGVQAIRRRLPGLPVKPDGVAFLEQQFRRAGVPLETVSEADRESIVARVDGHPGMLILSADVCASKGLTVLLDELLGRRGFYLKAVERLFRNISLSQNAYKCFDALLECRVPTPPALLASILPGDGQIESVAELQSTCVVDRTRDGAVVVVPLLRDSCEKTATLQPNEAKRFHLAASAYHAERARKSIPTLGYAAALEANYHAAVAGAPPPCHMAGLLDGLAAAAKRQYDAEHYHEVIRLLGPAINDKTPEDVLAMLADSYSWCDQFDEAFRLADRVTKRNRNYTYLFTEACKAAIHSRRWQQAQRAVQKIESLEPGSYSVDLYKGRLAEHNGDRADALQHYEQAARRTERDPWPHFYYVRVLLRCGKPEKALEAAEAGHAMIENRPVTAATRNLENALLSQELLALSMIGEEGKAKVILEVLEHVKDPRPEIVVCAAFVRAFYETKRGKATTLSVFESALRKLDPKESRKAHTRAQICFFRGRIFEHGGDLHRAEEEYNRASSLDPHNVHIKVCLLKVLVAIAKKARDEDDPSAAQSAARGAAEVVSQILKYDPNQYDALNAQQDLFHEFGVQ